MSVEVIVEEAAWLAALPEAEALATAAAEGAMATAWPRFLQDELTVLLADDDALRRLNARFRGKDVATNVLAFPAALSPIPQPEAAPLHLGDVAVACGVCAREAVEQGKPLAHHLQHLVVHGVLHLLSFDHETDPEAEEMEAVERTVLAKLGVPDPYGAAA